MDIKPRPHHREYILALRRMTADQRLSKAIELTELGNRLLADGLRRSHPDLPEAELKRLYLQRLVECHNRNY